MILPMKTTKYIILTLAALAALSCVRMDEPVIPEESGVLPLALDVRCGGLETRTPGEDKYNENKITHVDYFFFADEAGTQPLGVHGRAQAPESGQFLLKFDVENTAAYSSLKGTSYVYILANYSGEIDHAGSNPTLETILGLPVNEPLYTVPAGSTPASLPDSFVMDSYDSKENKYTVKLSPTKKDDVLDVTHDNVKKIYLSRLAVKLTVTLNFDKSIQTIDSFGNQETWTPEPKHTMEIYYVNALNNTTVAAGPVRRSENANNGRYFSYPTDYPFTPEANDKVYTYKTDPVYTYPQTWTAEDNGEPYFKLHMSWRSTVKDVAQFFYKIPVPVEMTLKRNCWYQVTVQVGVLGGTEEDYVEITDYFYCVADWAEPEWFSGSGLNSAKYFYVPGEEYHIYGDDNISIPYYCNADVNAYFTNITYMDYSGATDETKSRNFTGTSNTSVYDAGGEDNLIYTLEPDSENKVVKFTHKMTDIYVKRDITLRIVNSENTAQSKVVVIHQHPAIELKKTAAGDVFVNGHFARVSQNPGFGTTNNQGYYHSRNGWANGILVSGNGIESYNYTSRANSILDALIDTHGLGKYQYGSITDGSNVDGTISRNWYTTDITVTAFSKTNNYYTVNGEITFYKISDPRVKASGPYPDWSLDPYLTGETEIRGSLFSGTVTVYDDKTANWTKPEDILIASQAEGDRNMISPHFLVSSALNANGGLSWEQVVKRAATYQEAGYPAGRWRLPTEAEMAFIVARQKDKTIPALYANETYWAGSGRVMDLASSSSDNLVFRDRTDSDNMSVRFVYDLWYWGDEPVTPTYIYHPNGHFLTYKNN